MEKNVLIIGAGHAGGTVATLLRQFGYQGQVTLIGDEAFAPYQRPPLSKDYLKGIVDLEALKLKHDDFYKAHRIEVRLGVKVQAVDPQRKIVLCHTGETLSYDILIIATGARARPLAIPKHDLAGIFTLRNVADALALREELKVGRRLAIIGGGYVGLEVAASARALGAEVVVLEREPRVLARVASPALSDFFAKLHRKHSVDIMCNVAVQSFEGDAGALTGIRLADGRVISCDIALVGVGAQPNDEIARGAGLACSNGIEVDELARTSDPSIYAIGDVTFRPLPLCGVQKYRLESVPSAVEQAKQVASLIVGKASPPPEVPWFWSDQYDVKLQIAGITHGNDTTVIRGSVEGAKFAVFHFQEKHIVSAVEAINSAPEFMFGKQLIAMRRAVDTTLLRRTDIKLTSIIC